MMEKSATFCKVIGIVFISLVFCRGNLYGKAFDLAPCGMEAFFQEGYEEDIDLALSVKDPNMISILLENLTRDLYARCRNRGTADRALLLVREHLKKVVDPEIKFLTQEIDRISRYRNPREELEHLSNLKAKYGFSEEIPGLENYLQRGRSAASARKTSCSSIDNRRPPLMDVRHQDGMGWCFAFTAADLLSHKTGALISAFYVSHAYNRENYGGVALPWVGLDRESARHGGQISSAIKAANEKGLCLEKDLPSTDSSISEHIALEQALQRIENERRRFAQARTLEQREKACSEVSETFGALFPHLNLSYFTAFASQTDDFKFMDELIRRNCGFVRLSPQRLNVIDNFSSDKELLMQDINQQLESNNIVGISYYANILKNRYAQNLSGFHASSVVGRRWNAARESCEYLIRNSAGKGGVYDFDNENGYIWLPQDYLERTLKGVTYIE